MKHKVARIVCVAVLITAGTVLYAVFFPVKSRVIPDAVVYEQKQSVSDGKYATLDGDAFDEAYIADMLAHNEGTTSMAEQAQAVTARQEIRVLARDIIIAQGRAIVEMRDWQKTWGYKVTMSGGHMRHSGGGMQMAGDMADRQNKLRDLTGKAYDKEFLRQMVFYHEQAVKISRHAATNAKHPELKTLASEIITTQTKEIQDMKRWQKNWRYE